MQNMPQITSKLNYNPDKNKSAVIQVVILDIKTELGWSKVCEDRFS